MDMVFSMIARVFGVALGVCLFAAPVRAQEPGPSSSARSAAPGSATLTPSRGMRRYSGAASAFT